MMNVTFETSVRCGNHGRQKVYHNSVAAVRECYTEAQWSRENAEAEYQAERAAERYFEDRGYNEARVQEYYERNDSIPFDQAMRNAGYCDIHGWNVCNGFCSDQPADDPTHFADDTQQTGSDELVFAEEDDYQDDGCHCGHPECGAC